MATMGKQNSGSTFRSAFRGSHNIPVSNKLYQINIVALSVWDFVGSVTLPILRTMRILWQRLRVDLGQICACHL